MKKFLAIVVSLLLVAGLAFAGTLYEKGSPSYWSGNLATSQSGTVWTGSTTGIGQPFMKFTCSAVVTGAATTAASTFTISGGYNDVLYPASLMTIVVTGNSGSVNVAAPTGPYTQLRGALTTHATVSALQVPTSTVSCVAVH